MANYGCTCNGSVAGTTDSTGCSYSCGCNCQNGDSGTVGGTSTCNNCCSGGCGNGGTVGGVTGCIPCSPCTNVGGSSDCNESWLIIIAIVLLLLALFVCN